MNNGRMNGLYVAFHDVDPAAGVSQKIIEQVESFNNNGVRMSLLSYRKKGGHRTAFIDKIELGPIYSGIRCVIHEILLYPKIVEYIKSSNIGVLFIRYTQRIELFYLLFLKACKKLDCLLLLEIPTYPYDGEFSTQSLTHRIQISLERFFRKYLRNSIDYIVTTSEFDTIFGVKTIRISNAINPSRIPLRHLNDRKDEITMISVANLSFWHGLDRLIKGLYRYYENGGGRRVNLIIVGGGDSLEIDKLKNLINELNLDQYIKYVGPKFGEDLNTLYDRANLGVGCLACHRKSIIEVKSLKNVEYAMRGFPFFYSEKNTDFDGRDYVLKVPADDSDIDINSIVTFYDSIQLSPNQIRDSVSDLTWDSQIKKIINCSIR